MSLRIKKEDPLNFEDFSYNENDYQNDDQGSDGDSYSPDSVQKQDTSTSASTTRERPQGIEMPTFEEILAITDLNWTIALQRHKTTQELGNDSRTKIAKVVIKNIYEKKFRCDGNYDLKLSPDNFQYLADSLVRIFPTEVAETYFIRATKSKGASGKLYNCFVNTRAQIVDCGLLQVQRRNMNRSESTKASKSENQLQVLPPKAPKYPDALNYCRGTNYENLEHLNKMWETCYETRMKLLLDLQPLEYFNMFPYLKESNGYKLLIADAHKKFNITNTIDRLELITTKVIERLQRIHKGESLPKTYLQNYQSSADQVILSLILLPFLFTVIHKRSSTGGPKMTKQEMYNKFVPHFPSLTELEDYENTQNFIDRPVHVCVIGNLNDRPYAIVRAFNTKYHFGSPREAVSVALKTFLALKIEFPYEAILMWTFLKKFGFGLQDGKDVKIYPQVETMINEFNLYLRNSSL